MFLKYFIKAKYNFSNLKVKIDIKEYSENTSRWSEGNSFELTIFKSSVQ